MKKHFLFFLSLALVAAVSCNKEGGSAVPSKAGDGSPVEVTVSIRGSRSTKAVEPTYANESKVNNLQLFVFNGDKLEAHRSVNNSIMALVPATAGERTVWAVVNAPDLYSALNVSEEDPMTLPKLKAAVSNLSDNAVNGFVMTGDVTQELVDGGNVAINVKRIVSRVSINKVSASLKDYREPYQVRLEGIYLINVAGNISYDQSLAASSWANPLGHVDASFDDLLYDNLVAADPADAVIVKNNVYEKEGVVLKEHEAYTPESIAVGQYVLADGVTMTKDNAYYKEHVFYPYPNKFGTNDGETQNYDSVWSPRGTILVLEATLITDRDEDEDGNIDEIHGYYPLVLPVLERNKTYTIDEVRITRLPGDVPYKPIETGESQVTITVHDWELGIDMGTVNI